MHHTFHSSMGAQGLALSPESFQTFSSPTTKFKPSDILPTKFIIPKNFENLPGLPLLGQMRDLHLRQRVLTGGILIGLGEGDGLALVPSTNSAFEWYITRSQCKPAGIGMFTGQLDASLLCNLQLVFHSFRRCSSMTRNRQLGHAVSNLHGSSFHFVWVQGLADQRGLLLLT